MDKKLDKILKKFFKKKKFFTDNDNPETINEWDSLNHLNLIMEISKSFKINFSFKDTMEINNIGKLKKILKKKLK
jgi:acyl carrier protein